jgi:hypothetical protein
MISSTWQIQTGTVFKRCRFFLLSYFLTCLFYLTMLW